MNATTKYGPLVGALKQSIENARERGILKTVDDEILMVRGFVSATQASGLDPTSADAQELNSLAFDYSSGQSPFTFQYAKRRNHKVAKADAPAENVEN